MGMHAVQSSGNDGERSNTAPARKLHGDIKVFDDIENEAFKMAGGSCEYRQQLFKFISIIDA